MATHSSLLAWRIPWIGEPGGLQCVRLQRVGDDWARRHTHYAILYKVLEHLWISCIQGGILDPTTPLPHLCADSECASVCLAAPIRLFDTPWTVVRQAPVSMGILQARILEWVVMPSSRRSSPLGGRTQVSGIVGRFFLPSGPPGVWKGPSYTAKHLHICC